MGVKLLIRTDLRNDKDKRSLRLCQEVGTFLFEEFFINKSIVKGIAIINKYFSARRIQLEQSDLLVLLSHTHTQFANLSESIQKQIQTISQG